MEELPDSTDWIETALPSFEPLEAALRCEVCKEFYETPVITTCSHTFCSLCIRRCISKDEKCPTCNTACHANKLLPNNAVRDIVNRFQTARPKAIELARRKDNDAAAAVAHTKRKVDDTDFEDEAPGRQTRSRTTRSSARNSQRAMASAPFEVLDTEDEHDDDFVPEGMVACPMCGTPMKEELVWAHINTCNGERQRAATGAGAKAQLERPSPRPPPRTLPKDDSPAPSRLPGLNYALLKDNALRKKLQELGIPAWGDKQLMQRRHIEWLHLYNSNCDADDSRRKPKSQLLRELETWEKTQGGHARNTKSKVMEKDYDGKEHMVTHKTQFEDLIANARRKRTAMKEDQNGDVTPAAEPGNADTGRSISESTEPQHHDLSRTEELPERSKPYEGNTSALENIRAKVQETNETGRIVSPPRQSAAPGLHTEESTHSVGLRDPFGSPQRKVPMFEVPAEPVMDTESATAMQ